MHLYLNVKGLGDNTETAQQHPNAASFSCMTSLKNLVTPIKTLINDIAHNAPLPVIQNDFTAFANAGYQACQSCGVNITLPDQADFNRTECINSLSDIVEDAEDIVSAFGDLEAMMSSLRKIAATLPHTVSVCGIHHDA